MLNFMSTVANKVRLKLKSAKYIENETDVKGNQKDRLSNIDNNPIF